MNRRKMLLSVAGGLPGSLLCQQGVVWGEEAPKDTGLGICVYCLGISGRARKARRQPSFEADPLGLLEYCHQLGAGGIQTNLGVQDEGKAAKLRRPAEAYGMFVEGILSLPKDRDDLERFEAEMRTARDAGASTVRVVIIPGRRYERFESAEQFREFAERGVRSLELAEPIAAKYRIPLAIENHKDQRISERLALLKRLSSEYIGTCVDTGNSFALLEEPIEVVRAYAPWACSVHLKDQAVRECEDGFWFADVPLGEGFLELAQMVQILKEAKPRIRFTLELITRDPLPVPCLTEKYWATLTGVPGSDLARTLRTVRGSAREELPQVSKLSLDEQVEMETANVKRSLAYARTHLGL